MLYNHKTYRLNTKSLVKKSLFISFVGVGLSIIGFYNDPRFFHSYLVAYLFFATLSLGGLFFVLAHHMFGADWSIPIRRFAENLMILIPLIAILSLPIMFKIDYLYVWTDPIEVNGEHYSNLKLKDIHSDQYNHDSYEHNHDNHELNFWEYHPTMIAKKAYLNKGFFFLRLSIYFLVWFLLAFRLYYGSIKQEKNKDKEKLKKISAVGMFLFAITGSFFGFDMIMSLDPTWFSTMFGIYIFAGSYYGCIALMILISIYLRRNLILIDEINEKHYANLGKIAFTFTVFWAYIAGFQYYIIWYANLPEEINWFIQRWTGPFKYVSLVLIFGHFVIPFSLLIFNKIKRNKSVLTAMGTLMLIMHWLDLYWMVMPNYFRDKHGYISYESLGLLSVISWTDFSLLLAMGGLFMAIYWSLFKKFPIVPYNDSAFDQSITNEES